MISAFMKEWWEKVFLCPKCKQRAQGGVLQFDLCDVCFTHLESVAAEMRTVSESYIAKRDRQEAEAREKRQFNQMVAAMKQAIREVNKDDKL